MKKVRLTLKRGTPKWTFTLFDSAEAAFFLETEKRDRSEYCQTINLESGTFMEVEWWGVEYVYDKNLEKKSKHFDKVRIAKFVKKSKTSPKDYIEIAEGWVPGGTIEWSEVDQTAIRIFKIFGKRKPKFDFAQLFQDPEAEQQETSEFEEEDYMPPKRVDPSKRN